MMKKEISYIVSREEMSLRCQEALSTQSGTIYAKALKQVEFLKFEPTHIQIYK